MEKQLTLEIEELAFVEKTMASHANAKEAVRMAAYMKNHFPFLGIKTPARRALQKKWMNDLRTKQINRFDLICLLWEKPEREFHYVALDYLNKTPKKDIQKDDIGLIEELITTNSWWDSVDTIGSNFLGDYFQKFPEQVSVIISKWRKSENMWLRRSCLIFQLKYKNDVDFELLTGLIKEFQFQKEFFIQKAIGWSLRQYSKYNPKAVETFVNEINLQGLARREAIKYV